MSRRSIDPLAPSAIRATAMAAGLLLVAAFVGAAVRLLPWVLDPTIGWVMLAPFAKSLLSVAIEAAIVTGWGVGWALAAQRLVERGEARVLASLGESPVRTIMRLAPHAAILSAILAFTSVALGRDAAAPGRVVDTLLAEGHSTCASSPAPDARSVPFVSATWLCSGNGDAHLVGRSPIGGVVFTAANAHVSEDLRRVDLDDARLVIDQGSSSTPRVRVHAASLVLRGLAPWARASSLPPMLRAIVVMLSGLVGASAAVYALLRVRSRRIGRIAGTAMGAAGPLAALGALRSLEIRIPEANPGAWLALFALVPFAAALAVAAVVALVTLLPEARTTGTK